MTEVDSSCIAAIGYDGHTLTILFHSGKSYDYRTVPHHVVMGLFQASSIGAYYNRFIRGKYK